jgi:hypothetical protein
MAKRQVKLEMPANLNAVYSNAAVISQTKNEIVVDFLQIMPNDPRARVQSRVVMTPASAKAFLQALDKNIGMHEQAHGEIKTAAPPETLADQLFGGVKAEDGDDEEGEDE